MSSKPYLISSASMSPGVEEYLSSMRNLKDSVKWISIEYDPALKVDNLDCISNFIRVPVSKPYEGHLQRFTEIFNYFIDPYLEREADANAWWIFTDTSDVRFQTPIPDLGTFNKPIIAVSEGILHKEHPWWIDMIKRHPVFEPLLEEPVHNMGVVAMRGYEFMSFLLFLKEMQDQAHFEHNCDQALYNLYLWKNKQSYGYHPTLMTCLYDNMSNGNVFKQEDVFVNKDSVPYAIIHANGNTKESL